MKTLLASAAAIALLAAAGPVSAQNYPEPRSALSGVPPWMMDDGSSSDHPIHNQGDISGDRLNAQYSDGLTVPPGQGFPGFPGQR